MLDMHTPNVFEIRNVHFLAEGILLLIDTLKVLPKMFIGSVIGIAKQQLDMSMYNFIKSILVGTILGPYFEELLFRVVFFTSIAYVVGYIDNKLNSKFSSKALNIKSIFGCILIIVNNISF